MLEYIVKNDKPLLLIVTPLAPDHEISKETKKSIKRNEVPFAWVSYKSNNNCATNAQLGINAFFEDNKYVPPFFLLLDNSVSLGRHMLDRMIETLHNSQKYVAYCYCNFEFKGKINRKFPADDFDPNRLIRANYISSNSIIKTRNLREIGWLVTDNKYVRLLDWCTWLKFLGMGFIGVPCKKANFVDYISEKSVSAGDINDYQEKYKLVVQDFVHPIIERAKEESKKSLQKEDVVKLF